VLILVSMLSYPNRTGSRERLRFWLDSAAVLVAGGVLAWCSVTMQTGAGKNPGPTVVAAACCCWSRSPRRGWRTAAWCRWPAAALR